MRSCLQTYHLVSSLELEDSCTLEKLPQDRSKDDSGLLHAFRLLCLCQRRMYQLQSLRYLSVTEAYAEMPSALGLVAISISSKQGTWARLVELHAMSKKINILTWGEQKTSLC